MTQRRSLAGRFTVPILLISALSLSACASKPDRRGPPSDRQGPDRAAKSSSTFMQPIGVFFSGMDRNGDALISRAEVTSGVTAQWQTFQANPGAIQFSDWSVRNLGSTDAQPTFISFDHDFNGTISEVEFTKQMTAEFERLDINRDGQLARSEMIVAFQAPQGNNRNRERPSGGGGGGGRPPR